ncbi:MAG: 4Fe-4S binding protein [Clostridiales bacterium]|nr:4Fe-4S binding protein [Clostridiales bacterium]
MIEKLIIDFLDNPTNNIINQEEAITECMIGLKIFDAPLVGYADANDDLFSRYQDESDITYHRFMKPKQWLQDATTVISVFMPFTKEIKQGNQRNMKTPSGEWLHGRFEGQKMLNKLAKHLRDILIDDGYKCVYPGDDNRYDGGIKDKEKTKNSDYGGTWSERHVAYAAGLGTFGLSRGLITQKGVAGRFISLITNMEHEITERKYDGVYDYCNMCGECVVNCPANAISFDTGKDHAKCSKFLDWTYKEYYPRSACGKCQVSVQCESCNPAG